MENNGKILKILSSTWLGVTIASCANDNLKTLSENYENEKGDGGSEEEEQNDEQSLLDLDFLDCENSAEALEVFLRHNEPTMFSKAFETVVRRNRKDLIEFFLTVNVDVNKNGETIKLKIDDAVINRVFLSKLEFLEILELLFSTGKISEQTLDQALDAAVENKNYSAIEFLLPKIPDVIKKVDEVWLQDKKILDVFINFYRGMAYSRDTDSIDRLFKISVSIRNDRGVRFFGNRASQNAVNEVFLENVGSDYFYSLSIKLTHDRWLQSYRWANENGFLALGEKLRNVKGLM